MIRNWKFYDSGAEQEKKKKRNILTLYEIDEFSDKFYLIFYLGFLKVSPLWTEGRG